MSQVKCNSPVLKCGSTPTIEAKEAVASSLILTLSSHKNSLPYDSKLAND